MNDNILRMQIAVNDPVCVQNAHVLTEILGDAHGIMRTTGGKNLGQRFTSNVAHHEIVFWWYVFDFAHRDELRKTRVFSIV